MELIWSVLCSQSTIDQGSNTVSLFNVMEQLNLQLREPLPERTPGQRPALPVNLELVALWRRSNLAMEEHGLGRISVFGPNTTSEPIQRFDIQRLNLAATYMRFRQRARLQGLPFDGFGTYWFVVEMNNCDSEWNEVGEWEERARVPLELTELQNVSTLAQSS
jgi:hypothetical protein